jgi:RNA polymerase primary sigma factor
VAAFCRATGLGDSEVGKVLNLKRPPISQHSGDWLPIVRRIADALGVLPEELFTVDQIERPLLTNRAEMRIDAHDLAALGAGELPPALPSEVYDLVELRSVLDGVLKILTPREAEVLRRRFGLDGDCQTLDEVRRAINAGSRGRVRQLEHQALSKLRRSAHSRILLAYLHGIHR